MPKINTIIFNKTRRIANRKTKKKTSNLMASLVKREIRNDKGQSYAGVNVKDSQDKKKKKN